MESEEHATQVESTEVLLPGQSEHDAQGATGGAETENGDSDSGDIDNGDGDIDNGDNGDGDIDNGDIANAENRESSGDFDHDVYNIKGHKDGSGNVTRKKVIRKSTREEETSPGFGGSGVGGSGIGSREIGSRGIGSQDPDAQSGGEFGFEDSATRKRRVLEERMDQAVKARTTKRRRADEDDLERMQDDRIDFLKNKMIEAANLDVEKNLQGQIATEKLKLLREVMDTMTKADLAILILDNNLLEAVRLWLEPLPDASMPAYQIQKELLLSLAALPIKTDHLLASGIGKVLVFYQRSKRTEPNLKKIVDRMIGDWTRPILNKSDSYKDRTIKFHDYHKARFSNQLLSLRKNKTKESKSLYEQQAERRNRAAIPSARTTAYKIAPKVDPSLLMRQQRGGAAEMFTRINRKMTNSKKKAVKKAGPSIEGKHLSM